MHPQIKIPTQIESDILPQQGNTNTFQKDKSKQEILLDHRLVKTTMIYNHVTDLRRPINVCIGRRIFPSNKLKQLK